tara:strand:- start:10339 stop:10848 length:510 start_codon:yes stop_codon:yes gene_type:complete
MAQYNQVEMDKMKVLAKEQGLTLEEIVKKRDLDEEFSTYVDPKLESERKERLGLTAANTLDASEFEPIIGEAKHADTSHIGAEERAAGGAIGSVVGGIVAASMGIPPQIGAAAGGSLASGKGIGESATETAQAGIGVKAKSMEKALMKPGDEGDKPGKGMMTKIKGVLN